MPDYSSRRYALKNRWDPSHLRLIDRLLSLDGDQEVLEVGCGQGHLTRRLRERGVDVVGIDANPNARAVAATDSVMHMKAEALEFEDATFDAIVSIHAIEHIPPLERALSEMVRVLKERGRALYIYPAEPVMGLYAIPTSMILCGTPFKAREVHCHRLWPAKLRRMLEPLGMVESYTKFNLLRTPQFVSLFEKIG